MSNDIQLRSVEVVSWGFEPDNPRLILNFHDLDVLVELDREDIEPLIAALEVRLKEIDGE